MATVDPNAPAPPTLDPDVVLRELYSLSGSLEAVCQALPPGPATFTLRAIIEGGLPEVMHAARHAGAGATDEAGLEAGRALDRALEQTRRMIREDTHHRWTVLELNAGEADDVHAALAVTVDLLRQVQPGAGATLTRGAIPVLERVARRLDHERRHGGTFPNPHASS